MEGWSRRRWGCFANDEWRWRNPYGAVFCDGPERAVCVDEGDGILERRLPDQRHKLALQRVLQGGRAQGEGKHWGDMRRKYTTTKDSGLCSLRKRGVEVHAKRAYLVVWQDLEHLVGGVGDPGKVGVLHRGVERLEERMMAHLGRRHDSKIGSVSEALMAGWWRRAALGESSAHRTDAPPDAIGLPTGQRCVGGEWWSRVAM